MALVMLPCHIPWWEKVEEQLDRAAAARTSNELIDVMQTLHVMCNYSLAPEEDVHDPNLFDGLAKYIDDDLNAPEREHVFKKTIPRIAELAKALKTYKPPQGLHFSLQQQGDTTEYSYAFVASLIANAFFSTCPKRTLLTHPTLRDFNFTNFFKYLHLKSQKAKLRSIFAYFDYLDRGGKEALDGKLLISRQVMLSPQWLTIEDWLESGTPLCPLSIRHEGRIERAEPLPTKQQPARVCFASRNFGDSVLQSGANQESIQIATHPELLVAILSMEALEDNEALIVEGVRHISKIQDPKHRATFEVIPEPTTVTMCCIDAEDYSKMPLTQYEEDDFLRELNKSLLGFRQRRPPQSPALDSAACARRLSPIGESFSSTSPETDDSSRRIERINKINKGSLFAASPTSEVSRVRGNGSSTRAPSPPKTSEASSNSISRRKHFIVLGSSGEALPVTRKSIAQTSIYNSCSSQSTDSFHSAKDTVDEEPENEDEELKLSKLFQYDMQLDTPERRRTFAQRLADALKREHSATGASSTIESSESSYAVGISVAGSQVVDQNIKVKRGGGSRGFVLGDETVDEEFLRESLEAEQKWLGRFRQSQPPMLQRRETGASSRYSFSTEFSSELCSEMAEVLEAYVSKWFDEPEDGSMKAGELDTREKDVVKFAKSILKRTLSESLVGVPVQEGEPQLLFDASKIKQRNKLALAVRSLSLELAGQKSRRQPSTLEEGRINSIANHNVESEDEETFEDALTGDINIFRGFKNSQRRKLMAIIFTSEIFQTLFEDKATISLSPKTPDKEKSCKKISRENSPEDGDLLSVATGNWGCGSRQKGDPQLKLVIQWLAASTARAPRLIYYTFGQPALAKLDTVSRILRDREWSVGDLARATLRFSELRMEGKVERRNSLFEELLGVDRPSP